MFGEDAVRGLTKKAKASLDARVAGLIDHERDRFYAVLDVTDVRREQAAAIREAVTAIEVSRRNDPRLTGHDEVLPRLDLPELSQPAPAMPTLAELMADEEAADRVQ